MNIATATTAFLPKLVAVCVRNRWRVLLAALLLAAASLFVTSRYLGVTTDTGTMFASSLPWKQRATALAKLFPQSDKLIVAVIDARIPEEAEATATALATALRQDHTHFTSVTQPDALPYLTNNAFLLISEADLQDVLDRTTDAQPFLGQLVADPSLSGLFSALGLVVQGVKHGESLGGIGAALGKFQSALAAAAAGHPAALSWQQLLGGKLADQAGRYRFVIAKPILDYGALEPGGAATLVVRHAYNAIPYVQHGEARVRLTGQVVLDDEEFATVAEGAVAGLIGSFMLVILWLYLAVRSWRLMVPIMATLILGLLVTTGFAALVIGTLNLISVAFAVLFVGIAVDFAIQFTVRFRERRHSHPVMLEALRETGGRSGAQILVAALATASGFLAFAPTRFIGVAQLGVIAGFGMLVAFAATLTFLPALLTICKPHQETKEIGFFRKLDPIVKRFRVAVVVVFGLAAATGAALAPQIPFDGDPLHTKDQHSEAVRTLHDLMQNPITNPYTIQAVLPSLNAAVAAGDAYSNLKQTQLVLTLDSFLPKNQAEKLAAVHDVASLLSLTLTPPTHVPPVTAASLRQSAEKLGAELDGAAHLLKPKRPAAGHQHRRTRARPRHGREPARRQRSRHPLLAQATRSPARRPQCPSGNAGRYSRRIARPMDPAQRPSPRAGAAKTRGARWPRHAQLGQRRAQRRAAILGLRRIYSESRRHHYERVRSGPRTARSGAIAVILTLALRRARDVILVMTPLVTSSLLTALLLAAFRHEPEFRQHHRLGRCYWV